MIAVVIGVVVVAGGGDDDDGEVTSETVDVTSGGTAGAATTAPGTGEPTGPTAPGDTASETTTGDTGGAPGEIQYPLTYSEAEEQGIAGDIDWGERCDPETGRLAIPDFFVPECYAPFEGDNGGATDTGVTADTIKVVFYFGLEDDPIINYVTDAIAGDDTNDQRVETLNNVVRMIHTYYELYGRRIEFIPFYGTGFATDEVAARADAVRVAEEIQPFAVLGGPALTSAWGDELTARGIMCISCVPSQPTEYYEERDPLIWAVDANSAQRQAHVVEFVSKQLVGKNAEFAGEAFVNTPRKFGYVYIESGPASTELANRFADQMEEAGAPLAEVIPYALDPATIQQTALQTITRLKSSGVTTVLFFGDAVAPRDFTREATAQDYFPEWVLAASTLVDTRAFGRTYDQEQWQHAFGVTTLAAPVAPTVAGYAAQYEWFNGTTPPADESIGVDQPNLMLFVNMVQDAGPNLTHETWRDALFAVEPTQRGVSNPSLSWGDHGLWDFTDYHGIDDTTVLWWDADASGPDELRREGTGMWAYPNGGERYLPGNWPTEPIPLFQDEGAVHIFNERPPGEEVPEYEALTPPED